MENNSSAFTIRDAAPRYKEIARKLWPDGQAPELPQTTELPETYFDEPIALPTVGEKLLRVSTFNNWFRAAKHQKTPRELWLKTWYEGEVCCLFADSNLGKSIYAVQIGAHVARMGKRVIYCDFELTEKQIQLRYTDDNDNILQMPETFFRADLNPEAVPEDGEKLDKAILRAIEEAAIAYRADTVIVDNITYLSMLTESGDTAAELMVDLMSLKKQYGWSMLILAHTPKRLPDAPLSSNDLAGSKKLFNFFDCVLALGKSVNDEGLRYVKQLKVRHGAFTYDATNVVLYEIEKLGTDLRLCERGFSTEAKLLEHATISGNANIKQKIKEMRDAGNTQTAIAKALGISVASVCRACKTFEKKGK
ncbi:MAG: AAA family ATPase [Muribaculaceae bacterium]|nr:AAA family ATPase [Muribaculaceae bacterium]